MPSPPQKQEMAAKEKIIAQLQAFEDATKQAVALLMTALCRGCKLAEDSLEKRSGELADP